VRVRPPPPAKTRRCDRLCRSLPLSRAIDRQFDYFAFSAGADGIIASQKLGGWLCTYCSSDAIACFIPVRNISGYPKSSPKL
jgi:hypothetical protein